MVSEPGKPHMLVVSYSNNLGAIVRPLRVVGEFFGEDVWETAEYHKATDGSMTNLAADHQLMPLDGSEGPVEYDEVEDQELELDWAVRRLTTNGHYKED